MTTPITINDISDVARILRERPEWLDVLRGIIVGEELLSVPQQLAELTQRVDDLTQRLIDLTQRVDDLTQQVGDLTQQVDNLTLRVDGLTQRVDGLTQRVDEFIQATSENFRLVNERLDRLEVGQSDLRSSFARLEGRFSNFEGSEYERRVRNRLLHRATLRFNLNQPILAMVQDRQNAPELNSAIHRAIQSGAITMDDSEDLHEADIIIRDEDNRYLLAEVSITADETDLIRAVRRAGLLAGATDATVIPALVASNVPESQRALSDAHGVSLFIIPYP